MLTINKKRDGMIQKVNSLLDEDDRFTKDEEDDITRLQKKIFELEKRVEELEKPEKLFKDMEERVSAGENFTKEDVDFLFSETKDIVRREAIVKMNASNTNKKVLNEKYVDFLLECSFDSLEIEDIILKGTNLVSINDEACVIEVTKSNVTDEIEDFIYQEVMNRYGGQKEFRVEGDVYDKRKKNKYRRIDS